MGCAQPFLMANHVNLFYWALLGFSGHYWALLSLTEPSYWTSLLGSLKKNILFLANVAICFTAPVNFDENHYMKKSLKIN